MDAKKETENSPTVWILLGHKAGDNNQVLALAEALGWGWVEKNMRYIGLELIPNRLLRVTLCGLKKSQSDPLFPPWPDLVISAGRRNEPIARWIRKQSGGKCRLVHMGRPWARPKHFDLIVTTPQYDLPQAPNILHNELPLHRVSHEQLKTAAKIWQPKLSHLPRPWLAVFVGGDSSFCKFTAAGLRYLARSANELAESANGSLLVSTSARSPGGTLQLMQQEIEVPAIFFDYADKESENPYFGFLALADSFIVTAESTSMLTETCVTNKKVYLYDALRPEHAGDATEPCQATITSKRPGRAIGTWLRNHLGPKRLRRDVSRIHENLIQGGRISWLGEEGSTQSTSWQSRDLDRAVARTQALFEL